MAACYRVDPNSNLNDSIVDLLPLINAYTDIAAPPVTLRKEIVTARFNNLLNDHQNNVQQDETKSQYKQRHLWLLILIALAPPIILAATKLWTVLAVVGFLYLLGALIGGVFYYHNKKKCNQISLVSVTSSNTSNSINTATSLLAPTAIASSSLTDSSTNSSSSNKTVNPTIPVTLFHHNSNLLSSDFTYRSLSHNTNLSVVAPRRQ